MADGRKVYVYIQYVVIAVFVVMNLFAMIFIISNCTPVSYVRSSQITRRQDC